MRNKLFQVRDRVSKYMVGRYGPDELTRFESIILWIPMIISLFVRVPVVNLVCWFLMFGFVIHTYYRVFSKDIPKRYAENQKYLSLRYQMIARKNKISNRFKQRKTYRFYKCPSCRQEVRVPKGHGKICITCPKCREEFIRHS